MVSTTASRSKSFDVNTAHGADIYFDPACHDLTWSEAANQLLHRIRRISSPQPLSSSLDCSAATTNSDRSRKSSIGRSVSRLIDRMKRYMDRRSILSTHNARSQYRNDYDDRQYGFDSISSEIDRALMSTSSRTSVYLQEALRPHEATAILISDASGHCQRITVEEFTTVAQAILRFDPQADLCTKQLYEEIPELPGFVRGMEDHELVTRAQTTWTTGVTTSRYRLLRNMNKYTALTENQVLSDRSLSVASLYEEFIDDDQFNLMGRSRDSIFNWSVDPLQQRNAQTFVPAYVTSGVLWFRNPGHSWRKMFCFLHGSSVFYSLKRQRKSARYMRLLVDLALVDIFCPLYDGCRLPFRTPTNEIIICAPISSHRFDMKSVTVFATRTAEGRIAWQNGFRIHKFGISRLERNLEVVSNCDSGEQARDQDNAHRLILNNANRITMENLDVLPIDDDSSAEQSTGF